MFELIHPTSTQVSTALNNDSLTVVCFLFLLDKLFNYDKMTTTDVDTLNTPYDYESLMHYETNAFSNNGFPAIEALQPNVKIGQRYYLSAIDIQEVRLYYNCTASSPTLPPTTTAATTSKNPSMMRMRSHNDARSASEREYICSIHHSSRSGISVEKKTLARANLLVEIYF